MRAFYPGSFDPITNGHLDIITRLAQTFDQVIVAIGYNPLKSGWLPVETRVELIQRTASETGLVNVTVTSFSGLAVAEAKAQDADILVKGVRGQTDLPTEMTQAILNRDMSSFETFFIPSAPAWANLSSSSVRELVAFGAPIDAYVPKAAAEVIGTLKQRG